MLQQRRRSADVVVMVVGVQDRLQLQPPLLQPIDHRFSHRWIHHRGWAGAGAMQHKHVVVAEHRNQRHLAGGQAQGLLHR